jgi:two-component system sensor histidine kinase HydH
VQGAADLLGTEPARVEWERTARSGRDDTTDLLSRVEQAVGRLQQREREVRRAERLAALGQLAAGVAHEIRNPLTSALLLFQMARKDPTAGGLTEEDQDLIEQELQRIDRSLQAFLDYARPPQLARVDCDLKDLIRDALALVRGKLDGQGVTVELAIPDAGCRLLADPDQLRQVILNLLLNALDAMPQGGRLGITVQPSIQQGYPWVEFTVTDTGSGIPAEILDRMFEPFVTGKETGVGLGLVVCQRIVEDHHGTIRGMNRPDGGATFVVSLPIMQSSH